MTQINDLEERLGAMNSSWQQAKSDGGGFGDTIEDGVYQAIVDRWDWFERKSDGHAFLKVELKIAHNQLEGGKTAETVWDLEDPSRIGYLKRDLATLGLEVEDYSQLEKQLATLLDVPVEIKLVSKQKGDRTFQNVYINDRLGDPMRSDLPTEPIERPVAAHKSDDDIPF